MADSLLSSDSQDKSLFSLDSSKSVFIGQFKIKVCFHWAVQDKSVFS